MITAVDTCVLLDILDDASPHGARSGETLVAASEAGLVVVGEVVYAELAAAIPEQGQLDEVLDQLGITVLPTGRDAYFRAGRLFAAYRRQGGPRTRILPDFLIAAHALIHADRLLTRDRGFYRDYFPDLALLDPLAG